LIDLHCHILPGVDDGPADLTESLAMARQAVSDGVEKIVATPHVQNGVYHNLFSLVVENVENLQKALAAQSLPLKLYPGQEVHLCVGMIDKLSSGEISTLDTNGRYVLLELPFQGIPPGAKEEIFQLRLKGITPILAHPERNIFLQRQLEWVYDLVDMGCLVQITAMSITGRLGGDARGCAKKLLKLRLAHLIASDAHSSEYRTPVLSAGVHAAAKILGSMSEAQDMVCSRPEAVLAGLPIKIPEPERLRKRWWSF
jgi:protein-tyrosine phosphatase